MGFTGGVAMRVRFALAFRIHTVKTEGGRKKRIEAFVGMLKRGETIYPQRRT
jgi:uncharacterized protein YdeI (YjbR/CyaY-like superfamily)